nr:transketolase [Candidatus Delongbacteria bacterium]
FLAADGVEKANSGHPGMPMGMADCAYILWSQFLRFNPADPEWPGRDRFILSAGHGSMLLYAVLHLCGYEVSLEDLKNFRQWGSRTPGHPERHCVPGVETSTGPLGQGMANGIGMAIAARMMAARYNTPEHTLWGTHYIYGIVSDGDLMEGLSSEAASLAGHLKLGQIIYLYDDNLITIEGDIHHSLSESVEARFQAMNWQTIRIDGHDHRQIRDAIRQAQQNTQQPSLILARTKIGFGCPSKEGKASIHGAPAGRDELMAAKRSRGWDPERDFVVPESVRSIFKARVMENLTLYQAWQKDRLDWKSHYPGQAESLNHQAEIDLSRLDLKVLIEAAGQDPAPTRSTSGKVMQTIARLVPGFIGGSADLSPSTSTYLKEYSSVSAEDFSGRNFHFGIREHAMGSILNGIALYGHWIPFGSTFLVFADYMRPAIRLAAIMKLPVIYVFTHDSIMVGEDGPTHQPVEHLASLRIIPGLSVIRPADNLEVAAAWSMALQNRHQPTALILTRQKVNPLIRPAGFDPHQISRGGYILADTGNSSLQVVLAASGSEVELAIQTRECLQKSGIGVRVVSVPSMDVLMQQPESYRDSLFPADVPVVSIEAASTWLWSDLIPGRRLLKIGIDQFGRSGPYPILAEKYGLTAPQVAERIKPWLGEKQ